MAIIPMIKIPAKKEKRLGVKAAETRAQVNAVPKDEHLLDSLIVNTGEELVALGCI